MTLAAARARNLPFLRHPAFVIGAWTLAGVVAVLLSYARLQDSLINELTLWLAESLLSLSLVFVWGRGGIFSLGQTALYGIGAYAFSVVAINLAGTVFLPWALLAGIAVAALLAAVLGYFMFYGRVSPLNVGIITLAFTMVAFTILNSLSSPRYAIGTATLGGFNGMSVPLIRFGGPNTPDLSTRQMFLTIGILVIVATAGVAALLRSPFGRVMSALRDNETRTELLGIDVRLHRLYVFVFGGALAGLAGGLFASWGSYVSPSMFTLNPAVFVIIWVLVGGRTYVLAGIVGTLIIEGLRAWLSATQGQNSPIYLGILLIVVVLLAPDGLLGTLQSLISWLARRRIDVSPGGEISGASRAPFSFDPFRLVAGWSQGDQLERDASEVLSTAQLRKTFGGFAAVDKVDFAFLPRSIHCIIGPNGAGKSTLFALLIGIQRPSSGHVAFGPRTLNSVESSRRVRLGVGIKLQTASIFDNLSVYENLWIAGYSLHHSGREANRIASETLDLFGLAAERELLAGELAHGRQQWLEIAMVVARRPRVVLLDEPTAGMTVEETRRTAEMVRTISSVTCVVVIDHDMAFVRQLGAQVTVMHLGRRLAEGSLAELETSEEIRAIYLGGGNARA